MNMPVLTITQVARRLGLSTRTIRVYEAEGLVTLERLGRRCLLRPPDVEAILVIERLRADLGVNLSGIGVILEMRRKMLEMQNRLETLEIEFEARLRAALEAQQRELSRLPGPRGIRAVARIDDPDEPADR